jgi:hypothetical protein
LSFTSKRSKRPAVLDVSAQKLEALKRAWREDSERGQLSISNSWCHFANYLAQLGQLPYRRGTFEEYAGIRGFKKRGKKTWRKDVVDRLATALKPDNVVLGGGNVKNLKVLPRRCRVGPNSFIFRLW